MKQIYEKPQAEVVKLAPWLMDGELIINLSNPQGSDEDARSAGFGHKKIRDNVLLSLLFGEDSWEKSPWEK